MDRWLSYSEVLKIPEDHFPLAVLSFNYRSIISVLINKIKGSHYNHFMWAYKPGYFASQGAVFGLDEMTNYLKSHRLKFWYNPDWSDLDRKVITSMIKSDLRKSKITTRYDWIAIIGQALRIKWLQNPYTKICSDYGDYLKTLDGDYDLKNPAPSDINDWFKSHSKYKVYGRYVPD